MITLATLATIRIPSAQPQTATTARRPPADPTTPPRPPLHASLSRVRTHEPADLCPEAEPKSVDRVAISVADHAADAEAALTLPEPRAYHGADHFIANVAAK